MTRLKKYQRPLSQGDVVRVIDGQLKDSTGVVNRVSYSSINVFLKGESIGIWFSSNELKRIGRTKK